jgi:ABC-2 type transport system ATP-binding protein
MSDTVLAVQNLKKNYGEFVAVDGISFSVPRGKIVGFLGPNGAGKTTTIQILSGITLPNGGSISYFGHDFASEREACLQRINMTSAFNTLMGRISVWENLFVFAELYQINDPRTKIETLLGELEASDLKHRLYKDLSTGQKTRINLVKSLLNDPEILLMDEPTASLDPDIADKTLTLIEKLRAERNLSILYTSHNMNEITRICDEVIFLDHGRIVAHDTKTPALESLFTTKDVEFSLSEHAVEIRTSEQAIPGLLFDMSKTGIWIEDIDIRKPTLEDVFLQIART